MNDAIIGIWDLVTAEGRYDDGAVEQPFGPGPKGLLVYTPEGRMTVQLSRTDRERFASDDVMKGTPDETGAAFCGYMAYFGRYRVNAEEGVVIHHVEGSLFPNWAGGVLPRMMSVEGDRLVLATPPFSADGRRLTVALTWQRSHGAASAAKWKEEG